jgi:hypothetical protein
MVLVVYLNREKLSSRIQVAHIGSISLVVK